MVRDSGRCVGGLLCSRGGPGQASRLGHWAALGPALHWALGCSGPGLLQAPGPGQASRLVLGNWIIVSPGPRDQAGTRVAEDPGGKCTSDHYHLSGR